MRFITTRAHTIIGLIVGVLLIFSPNIFGFNDHMAASTVALVVGIFIVLSELISTSPYSPLKLVPMKAHIVVDVITGLFLAASPWIFNFMDNAQKEQWVPHLVVGILIVGYALLTRVADDRTRSVTE